jgi:hypothetical protein
VLTDTFLKKLDTFLETAKIDGLSVSAKPNKNFRYIGEFLKEYKLSDFFPKGSTSNSKETMADLLIQEKSLKKVVLYLQASIDLARKGDFESNSPHRAHLDGLVMLRDCFQLLRSQLNKKSRKRTSEEPLFICALCWRRVRVSDRSESEGRKASTFYCPTHLPNKSEHFYRRDKTALYSAMRTTDNRFKEELKFLEDSSFKSTVSIVPSISKWVSSFAARPSRLYHSIYAGEQRKKSWQSRANHLVQEASAVFPLTYEKVQHLDANDFDSPENWLIGGIVNALDDSKEKSEVAFWWQEEPHRLKFSSQTNGESAMTNCSDEETAFDEYLMMMSTILARYEATEMIRLTPQPRGTFAKKSKARKV